MSATAWDLLDLHQQAAASAAARLVEDADLKFVMMLFGANGRGAVISNIEPADAVKLIEGALMAAKSRVEVEQIRGERLQ